MKIKTYEQFNENNKIITIMIKIEDESLTDKQNALKILKNDGIIFINDTQTLTAPFNKYWIIQWIDNNYYISTTDIILPNSYTYLFSDFLKDKDIKEIFYLIHKKNKAKKFNL
jgi:hypothetical protein